jgi:hypothetical protein
MATLANLEPLFMRKARGGMVHCNVNVAKIALGWDTVAMRRDGYDPSIIEEHEKRNELLKPFLEHPIIGEYLTAFTPTEIYMASDVRVLPLACIRGDIAEGAAPGGYILPHGYLVFATDVGGNAICFCAPSASVVWVDHTSFSDDSINYKNRTTGDWHTVPFTQENIDLAAVKLSDDIPVFLADLLRDRLAKQLEELD